MKKNQMRIMVSEAPVRHGGVRDWQRWAPFAAVAWSLIYAALGIFWLVKGQGFPYSSAIASGGMGPILSRLGPVVAWIIVITAGIPAMVVGDAMLHGVQNRVLRPIFITFGGLLSAVLLLFTADLTLLEMLGYTPYAITGLFTGAEVSQIYLQTLARLSGIIAHQLFCILGGFLWLAATTSYARLSRNACLYCGRREGQESYGKPDQAARLGRIAVIVAMVVPIFYAVTRFIWVLGFPLGMTEEYLRQGQERGMWTTGAFLAGFGLVGAILMLGLVQRWGEVFPRWMIGLAGRRVPIALAVIPATLASVILIVGGIAIWSGLGQMINASASGGAEGIRLFCEIFFQVGPTLLFPIWGVALAVATVCYYYRRRGQCKVCGRGELS